MKELLNRRILYLMPPGTKPPMPPDWYGEEAAEEQPAPAPAPLPPNGTRTAWGGIRGDRVEPRHCEEGMRFVNGLGEHGVLTRVRSYTMTVVGAGFAVASATEPGGVEKLYEIQGRLDNGRTVAPSHGDIYHELAPPTIIVPDLELDNGVRLSPSATWREVKTAHDAVKHHRGRAARAKVEKSRASALRDAEEAHASFLYRLERLKAHLALHPATAIQDFDHDLYQSFLKELDASERGSR